LSSFFLLCSKCDVEITTVMVTGAIMWCNERRYISVLVIVGWGEGRSSHVVLIHLVWVEFSTILLELLLLAPP